MNHERHERKKTLDLLFKDECSRIVGACFEVYKEKGTLIPVAGTLLGPEKYR
jgi:hypothetical protein